MWVVLTILLVLIFCLVLAGWTPGTALIASPVLGVVCIGLAAFAGGEANVLGLIVALLIFPATVIRLKLGSTDTASSRWPFVVNDWILSIGWYILALALLIVVFQPFGPVLFALFIAFSIHYSVVKRRALTIHVLSTLAVAMRQNLPLPMALDSAAQDDPTRQGQKILKSISDWLKSGYSLSQALRLGYPKCPPGVLASVEAAETIGRLPDVLASAAQEVTERTQRQHRIRSTQITFTYPLVVATIALLVMLTMLVFITPVYVMVLQDVGEGAIALPASTQLVIGIGEFFHEYALIIGILVLLAIGLWLAMVAFGRREHDPTQPSPWRYVRDWLRWHLPLRRKFERMGSLLQTLSVLRCALLAGHTIDRALAIVTRTHMNYCFTRRLQRWHEAVVNGQEPGQAARQAGAGAALAWAFDERLHATSCPEALAMLEESFRSQYDYRLSVVRNMLGPLLVLLLGGMIGLFVHALFMPIVTLNQYYATGLTP